MGKYIKLFKTTSQYTAYVADTANFITPNVSLCEDNLEKTYYNPYDGSAPMPNVITYSAPSQLPETTASDGLHVNAFNAAIVSHEFADGVGRIEFDDAVTTIGYEAFMGCRDMTNVDIPSTVTSIGDEAYGNCNSLESIVIPNGVTSIGASAFDSCSSMTSCTVPDSVTSIGEYAFANCSSLADIKIPSEATSINAGAFKGCAMTSVDIPSGVTNIGYGAFSGSSLTSVTIPSAVTNIGYEAFASCSSLEKITCEGATAPIIQNDTFQGVKPNGTLTVPSGSSGYDTWMQNSNYYLGLYNWNLKEPQPGNVITYTASAKLNETTEPNASGLHTDKFNTTIASHDFDNGVGTIVFDADVTEIGDRAFSKCSGVTSVELPNTVTGIGYCAFMLCSGLTSIEIPSGVTSIDQITFSGCTSLTSVTIPNTVTSIGEHAFADCHALTSIGPVGSGASLEIPNSLTRIGQSAFATCNGLTSVTIPDSVTTIGGTAFSDCWRMTSLTIGSGVTSIGDEAFDTCSSLESATINATTPPQCGYYTFPIPGIRAIYVPCASLDAYKAAEGWSDYTSKLQCIPEPQPGGNVITYTASAKLDGLSDSSFDFNPIVSHTFEDGVGTVEFLDAVTTIGYEAFRDYSGLTSIEIPNGVESIGDYAFYNCNGMTSVTIPNTVTSIGGSAFEKCTSLPSVTIPDSVESIGNAPFAFCSGLTSVTIGSGVTSITWNCFVSCSGLTSVTIPSGVTSIDSQAFLNCSSLESIICEGATAPIIQNDTFQGVKSNGKLYVPANSTGYDTWMGSGEYYLGYYNWNLKEPLPNNTIRYAASEKLAETTSLYTSGLHTDAFDVIITSHTFDNGVGTIVFDGDVTDIGDYAFYNSNSMTSVDIPNTVTSIGNSAFYLCGNLTSIELSSSLTTIGVSAFTACENLTGIVIPSGVTTIEKGAFGSCRAFTSVTIFDSVTTIGDSAFVECSNLTSITCEAITPPTLVESTYGGYHTFNYTNDCPIYVPCESVDTYKAASGWRVYASRIQCVPEPLPNNMIRYTSPTKLNETTDSSEVGLHTDAFNTAIASHDFADGVGTIVFNADVTNIGARAFYGCDNLTLVELPNSVTSIGEAAFYGAITGNFIIPSGVTSIGEYAFNYCIGLTSVIIPDSVTSIGEFAFSECYALTSITCEATTPPTMGSSAFDSTNDCPIYVPYASVDTYKAASGWIAYASRIKTNNVITYTASAKLNETTSSYGNGLHTNAFNATISSHTFGSGVGTIIFNGDVTSIGERAFYGSSGMTSIDMPNSVTSIGDSAFRNCSGLTIVNIPKPKALIPSSVTKINNSAFFGCSSLTSVTIPNSVTSVGTSAFQSCVNMRSVTISTSITQISDSVFSGCTSLTSVTIPSGVASIGQMVFDSCSGLTSITLESTIPPSLGWNAFNSTNNCPIYVPSESVDAYKAATGWSDYTSRIQAMP